MKSDGRESGHKHILESVTSNAEKIRRLARGQTEILQCAEQILAEIAWLREPPRSSALPCDSSSRMSPPAPRASGEPSAGKIFVIDDSPALLGMVKPYLESHGFEVHTSQTPQCVPLLMQENPDLILLDVEMPCLQGDFYAEMFVETRGLMERGLIVYYSGLPESQLQTLVQKSGVAGYLSKSASRGELLATVKRFVAQARQRSAAPVP